MFFVRAGVVGSSAGFLLDIISSGSRSTRPTPIEREGVSILAWRCGPPHLPVSRIRDPEIAPPRFVCEWAIYARVPDDSDSCSFLRGNCERAAIPPTHGIESVKQI